MNNVFDVIYTTDLGQSRVTFPMADLPRDFFESQERMLKYLLFAFNAIETTRNAQDAIIWSIRKLVKISTCIYSDNFTEPEWYEGWDGKFWHKDIV